MFRKNDEAVDAKIGPPIKTLLASSVDNTNIFEWYQETNLIHLVPIMYMHLAVFNGTDITSD